MPPQQVRTTQPKTRAKELARGFGRFEGHANRWVDAKHKVRALPRDSRRVRAKVRVTLTLTLTLTRRVP